MPVARSFFPILIFAAIYAAIALVITNSYYQLMMTLVLVWATFGLSWNILSGYTGLISFGHAAFFGIGAYTTALGQMHFDLSPWLLIPIAAVFGGLSGLLIGFPTFRLRSHYFALAMLAYPLAVLYVFEWLGYQEVTLPMKRENAFAFMQFSDPRIYTLIALGMTIVVVLLSRIIERSRFGMSLIAIKQNEAAAEAAGINTLAWKLRAIAVSGAVASATGAFYAVVLLVVTPVSVFGMLVSAQALTVTMFGGVGTVWGPVIGSAILIPASEILQAQFGARFPGIQGVIFGFAIVVVILAAPEGLFWKGQEFVRRRWPGLLATEKSKFAAADGADTVAVSLMPEPPPASQPQNEAGKVILSVRGLSRSFGGTQSRSGCELRCYAKHDPRHYWTERCWKNDRIQPAQRVLASRCRQDSFARSRRGRLDTACHVQRRRRPHFPDHAPIPPIVGHRKCRHRRLRACKGRKRGPPLGRERDRKSRSL